MQWHPVVAAASSRGRLKAIGPGRRKILKACDPLPQCLCLCAVRLLRAHVSGIVCTHVFLAFPGQLCPSLTLRAAGLADIIRTSALHSRDKGRGAGGNAFAQWVASCSGNEKQEGQTFVQKLLLSWVKKELIDQKSGI
jgi:hypothetical protein